MNKKIAAWAIHAYTASGGIIGMLALYAASQDDFHRAFLLLALTVFIDGTDGVMARAINIKQVLPNFNGAEVDNVIDVLTYVWIPTFIMWKANLLPHPIWTIFPVIGALYAYGQINMKSEDGFFIGFPSYWNFVAAYLYWLHPGPTFSVAAVVILCILSFVPTRYLYPSKGGYLWRISVALTAVWGVLILYLLIVPEAPKLVVLISLLYAVYYFVASFYAEYLARTGKLAAQG